MEPQVFTAVYRHFIDIIDTFYQCNAASKEAALFIIAHADDQYLEIYG